MALRQRVEALKAPEPDGQAGKRNGTGGNETGQVRNGTGPILLSQATFLLAHIANSGPVPLRTPQKAGKLSLEEANNPELNLTTRLQAETYGHYYLAEQMSCLATFHYEQRQTALAAKEHQEAIEHLTRSIAVGSSFHEKPYNN